MTEAEARAILDSIKTTEHQAETRRLASGDIVIVMSDGVFIWTKAEWKQYKKGTLPALHEGRLEGT